MWGGSSEPAGEGHRVYTDLSAAKAWGQYYAPSAAFSTGAKRLTPKRGPISPSGQREEGPSLCKSLELS